MTIDDASRSLCKAVLGLFEDVGGTTLQGWEEYAQNRLIFA